MFLTREAAAQCAEIVLGAPAAHVLQVDALYDSFLALCEVNKRPIRAEVEMFKVANNSGDGGSRETAPAGAKRGVLIGLKDVGVVPGFQGKMQHKLDLRWQIPDKDSTGKRFLLTQRVTATWGGDNMPSGLRKVIDAIRMGYGEAPLTQAECDAGPDVEQYFGKNAYLMLVHNPGQNGKVFANIKMVMPRPDQNDIAPEGDVQLGVIDAKTASAAGNSMAERAQKAAEDALRARLQAESDAKQAVATAQVASQVSAAEKGL